MAGPPVRPPNQASDSGTVADQAAQVRTVSDQAAQVRTVSDQAAQARYVAIITDGNGRWARAHGVPVNEGHSAGADTVKARLRDAVELGIEELTVYSFSTENWSRPAEEVQGLMDMFGRRIDEETPELHAEGVRMRFIGRREGLPEELVRRMAWAESLTGENTRITLFVAFNYGGRAEIIDAARAFQGGSEEDFRRLLYAPEMHDPDVIIRTSGERRLSNYLLWQSAYSELVFREELWPDFSRQALRESLEEFAARKRRFGGRA
jgi:undecaprenyl diphosphate synthase